MKKLFRANCIVTCNQRHEVIEDGFLAIERDKIIGVGPWTKRPKSRDFKIEELPYGMITPGLINLHTHLPMTLLKGIVEDVDLETWLMKYIFPAEKSLLGPEFIKLGTELAMCESIKAGITCSADMYYWIDDMAEVIDRAGARALLSHSCFDDGSFQYGSVEECIQSVLDLASQYQDNPRILPMLAAHAPYTCNMQTLQKVAQAAEQHRLPVSIHLAETKKESVNIKRDHGMSPLQLLQKTGILNAKFSLLAHCVWLEEADYEILSQKNISCILNPQSNSKLASGVANAQKMLSQNIRFCIGTDGSASNNNLDLLSEIDFFTKIHHLTSGDLKGMPGPEVFDSITIKAAEAIAQSSELGSLETGKQADFIVIDLDQAHLAPFTKAYSHLIYSVRGSDVDSTYVAGKCLMKERKIKTLNEQEIVDRAQDYWKKIERALQKEGPSKN